MKCNSEHIICQLKTLQDPLISLTITYITLHHLVSFIFFTSSPTNFPLLTLWQCFFVVTQAMKGTACLSPLNYSFLFPM